MPLLRCVAFAFLFLAATPFARAQPGGDYLPLRVRNQWTYRITQGDGQTFSVTRKIAAIERKGDLEVARAEGIVRGKVVTERISRDARGIYLHSWDGLAIEPPVQVLRTPVKPGETWEAETVLRGVRIKISMRALGEEEVVVPAGTFRAVGVAAAIHFGEARSWNVTKWYAANVGLVRERSEFGSAWGVYELEKVELAK